ncbi:NAD-dependent epimerase/dehydratase family protein [Arhodomonas sp. AD133]|uniref:NAD-dependent epimerase/dehydratase family protein n=1 Tax=Arhodomonas sp. AD133 TaxID=3415009 RepID=UPI003EBE573E
MRVLVIGGSGFVGGEISAEMLRRGHEVTVLHRGKGFASLPEGAREILADRNRLLDRHGDLKVLKPDVVIDVVPYTQAQAGSVVQVFSGIAARLDGRSRILMTPEQARWRWTPGVRREYRLGCRLRGGTPRFWQHRISRWGRTLTDGAGMGRPAGGVRGVAGQDRRGRVRVMARRIRSNRPVKGCAHLGRRRRSHRLEMQARYCGTERRGHWNGLCTQCLVAVCAVLDAQYRAGTVVQYTCRLDNHC